MGNNSNVKYVSRQCLDRKRPKGDFNVPFLPEPIAADQDRANGELDVSGCIHYHDPRVRMMRQFEALHVVHQP